MDLIFNKKFIAEKLLPYNSEERIKLKDPTFQSSAVIFTIIPYADKPYDLVLIHRTEKGTKHRGEISFPGGKFEHDKDKSLRDTALRETEEEIGVPSNKVAIIGCLHDFPTLTRYIITPFVGTIPPDYPLIPDEREVQVILKVPISFFTENTHFSERPFEVEGKPYSIFYFNYKNPTNSKIYNIWGATAYMIMIYLQQVHGFNQSKLGIRRPDIESVKKLKDYLKYKKQITSNFES